jgi:hypothetical protein
LQKGCCLAVVFHFFILQFVLEQLIDLLLCVIDKILIFIMREGCYGCVVGRILFLLPHFEAEFGLEHAGHLFDKLLRSF